MVVATWARLRMPRLRLVRLDCLRADEAVAGGFLDGGAVGDDQRDGTRLAGVSMSAEGGWAGGEAASAGAPRPPYRCRRDHQMAAPLAPVLVIALSGVGRGAEES